MTILQLEQVWTDDTRNGQDIRKQKLYMMPLRYFENITEWKTQ